MFFMWGVLTQLNDILVPHLKAIFGLSYAQVMLIQFSFFSGYFVFAIPSGKLLERIGYKRTMIIGLAAMGLGRCFLSPQPVSPLFLFFWPLSLWSRLGSRFCKSPRIPTSLHWAHRRPLPAG